MKLLLEQGLYGALKVLKKPWIWFWIEFDQIQGLEILEFYKVPRV